MPSMFDILQPPEPRQGLPGIALGQGGRGIGNVLGRSALGASDFAQANLPAFFNPEATGRPGFESGTEAFLSALLGTTLAGIGGPARAAQQAEGTRQEQARKLQMDLLEKSFPDLTPESKSQIMEQAGIPGLKFEGEPVKMGEVEKEFMTETFDIAASVYTNKAASPEDKQVATSYLSEASKALGMNNEELFKALELMSKLNLPYKGFGQGAKTRAMSPRDEMAYRDRLKIEDLVDTGQAPNIETAEQMYFGEKKDRTAFANYKSYYHQAAGGGPLTKTDLVTGLIKAQITADPIGGISILSEDPKAIKRYGRIADMILNLSGTEFDEKGNLKGAVSPQREEYTFPPNTPEPRPTEGPLGGPQGSMTKLPMNTALPQISAEDALTAAGMELGLGDNPIAINEAFRRLKDAAPDSAQMLIDLARSKMRGAR